MPNDLAWPVATRSASSRELVLERPEVPSSRLAVFSFPSDRALVLGSTEDESDADRAACERLGFEVVRRKSGGGSVLIVPGSVVWLDLFVARRDPLFDDDVAAASLVAGRLWRDGLSSMLGSNGRVELHGPRMSPARFSRTVCFSGLGPGEVLVSGKKVVGVAQRRDRLGAWFFTICYLERLDELHASLLSLDAPSKAALLDELASSAAFLAARAEEVLGALRGALESGGDSGAGP